MPKKTWNSYPRHDKPFPWSDASAEAAFLCAEDRITDARIAERAGITRQALGAWKTHPEFKARIEEHLEEMQKRARRRGLARLDRRQDAQFKRHKLMMQLLAARARDMREEVAGGGTGLLVRSPKRVEVTITTITGDAADSETSRTEVFEYQFDAALMRELRELEKQIAQDSGTWTEKHELSGGIAVSTEDEAAKVASRLGVTVEEVLAAAEKLAEQEDDA